MIGLLHVHSENSIKDCALLIPDIIKKAKELGYDAVALTDQGSMTGIAEFINTAKKMDVKPVPGVEIAIRENEDIETLVLMASDYTGYVGICKAVSTANRSLVHETPVLSYEDLQKLFSPNTPYHGHVYATSSDFNGILGRVACSNISIQHEISEKTSELKAMKNDAPDLKALNEERDSLKQELDALRATKKEISKRTGKNFSKKEENLEKLRGTDLYQEAYDALETEKADCSSAESEVKSVTGKITRRNKKLLELTKQITEATAIYSRIEKMQQSIDNMEHSLQNGYNPYKDTSEKAQRYNELFGNGYFFIELMFHGLEEEAAAVDILGHVAYDTHIPTVLSNDVHILERSDDDVLKRRLIQSLKDNKWQEGDEHDYEYYMKTEEDLANTFMGLIPEEMIQQSLDNMHLIFDSCSFEWPEGKHYPKYHDRENRPTDEVLREEARKHIPEKFPGSSWTPEHEKRLEYELSVISESGYSDYTMILSEILKRGKEGPHDGKPGYYIGPGRGSGVGSLTNYLMSITNLDPLQYDLIFERYLNVERISPPDIDSDIATSIRPLLIQYITKKYSTKGEDYVGVCSIVTKSRLTAKDAIRAAGRIESSKMYGNAAKLYSVADRIAKKIPLKGDTTLAGNKDALDEFTDSTEQEIISYARLIENVLSKYGTHAAGIIISDSGDVTDYAPVMNTGTNENPEWTIQFDKEESEQIGLLKLDALGLSTLDIFTNTIQRIYNTRGELVDINHIPFEKEVFEKIYSQGNTVGVFQCKSNGMRHLWKQMQPDSIEDIIAGIALYRPGPMDFIPQYIKGKKDPLSIEYVTPQLEPILKDTYGTIVYQEQVMRIVRDLAGYSMGRSDLVRRAMAKKKQAIMDQERQNFIYGNEEDGIPGCVANGISAEKAAQVYDLMVDFAKYAFNKSHAAAYAMLSYQSAWLKYHYPMEFLIESMNVEKPDEIPVFVDECKKCGFKVLGPDINHSALGFSEYDGAVIYGLGSVKGVKNGAAPIIENRKKGGAYVSFQDYLLRSGADSTSTKALINGGAFDCFCKSRKTLMAAYEDLSKYISQIKTVKKRIEDKTARLENEHFTRQTDRKRLETGLENDESKLQDLTDTLFSYFIPAGKHDPVEERLQNEKNVLFTYVSGSPLDQYQNSLKGTIPIASIDVPGKVTIAGFLSDIHRFPDKRSHKEMAAFSVEDNTKRIRVMCFADRFEKYGSLLKDGAVLKINGSAKTDRQDDDEMVIYLNYAVAPDIHERETIFESDTLETFNQESMPEIQPYIVEHGSPAVLFELSTGKCIYLGFCVNEDVKNTDVISCQTRSCLKGGSFFAKSS